MGSASGPPPGLLKRLRRRLRNGRRRVYAGVARAAVAGISRVPYPMVRAFSRGVVAPACRAMFKAKACANLRLAFGEEMDEARRREVVRQMFTGLADLAAEVAAFHRQGPRFLQERVDDAAARAKIAAFEAENPVGWIGVTGHVGNWELMAHWMHHATRRGVGGVVAKRIPNPHLNQLVHEVRLRHGMETLYNDDPPTRLVRILRERRILGLVPDQDSSRLGGVFVRFFGRPAYTPLGPARLALAARAPILCAFLVRQGDRFVPVVGEPIVPDLSRPRDEEAVRITQAWSDEVEAVVRAYPEQWPWFHERWKTTPEKLIARGRQR